MKRSPPVLAMSLDVDGTLYAVTARSRLARLVYGDVRRIIAEPRWKQSLVPFRKARERARKSVAKIVDGQPADGRSFRDHVIAFMMKDLGSDLQATTETYDWMTEAIAMVGTKGRRPYAGVRRAILAASRRALKIGIISDYDAALKLKNLGLDDLPWATVIACDALGILKPSPQPFLTFAERIGVDPESILHVGDREDTDVDGALAAGMRAWRFAPPSSEEKPQPGPSRAEHVFSAWSRSTFAKLWE